MSVKGKLSFFKLLVRLEKLYNEEEYPSYASDILKKLIRFVQECEYDHSENRKFVSRNFRLTPEELVNVWNIQHPEKPKQVKTFYSQTSTYSTDLYNLFGANIETWFSAVDKTGDLVFRDKVLRVEELIDAMAIANKDCGNIFISEFDCLVSMAEPVNELKIEDCQNEIAYMKQMMRTEVQTITSKVDMGKVAKIRQILRTPLFEAIGGSKHRVNHEKLDFIKAFSKKLPVDRKPQQVFMHSDLKKAMSSVFELNKSTEVSEANVNKLAEVLYQYYTADGIKEVVSGCNMYELAKAVEIVKNGNFK